ncbi:MAG TPA: hypothetical protein VHL79_14935, partial [Ramlibacter sp.]|nr:hypothetical protein [Ramlibacter sp.]
TWIVAGAAVIAGAAWLAAPRNEPRTELLSIRNAFASGKLPEAKLRELHARKQALLKQAPELQAEAAADHARQLAGRTIDLLEAPLVLGIKDGELTIHRLKVVLGTFDAPSLKAHIDQHRGRLVRELAERLAQADALRLGGNDGEAYLKGLVERGLAASLATRPEEEYPSTYHESPGRHGVVEVVLPDSFTLRLRPS